MRPSPCLSQWELLEGFSLVQSESRAIRDHWVHGKRSSGDEGGVDRAPSQDMLVRPQKALLSPLQSKMLVGLCICCLMSQIQQDDTLHSAKVSLS